MEMIGVAFMQEQAELYRRLAADVTDASLRKALIELAETYERIARQLASSGPPAG
jgi:hypothetical protein